MLKRKFMLAAAAVALVGLSVAGASAHGTSRTAYCDDNDPMLAAFPGWTAESIFTVGQEINGYTPPGIMDGIGAFKLDRNTVRFLVNHELLNFRGYPYDVDDGMGGTFSLTGARISYFDVDRRTRCVVDSGLAYDKIYDAIGNQASDAGFLANNFAGFSRFCSASYFPANEFGKGRGLRNGIFFTGEEDGGGFNPVGGAEWALDPVMGEIWHCPDLGRGAWENVTTLDTGDKSTVAILLADDTSPFDADNDGVREAAPLYLYVGTKGAHGDFPTRNGLRGGKLYVWVADNGATSPLDFKGSGSLAGSWVEVDNSPNIALADEAGINGYDEFGYPTQRNLWTQAEALGAFGFSRPEDVATNPRNGSEAVLASTGVDTFAVDPMTGDGVDTFGTMYTIDTDFDTLTATLTIIYDGDADPTRALRSPDNLDWADNGKIYVQEDRAEADTLASMEPLFGAGAANPNEAGIVCLDPKKGTVTRIANVDRTVVLDASIADATDAVDVDAGDVGAWESSGILDVSKLFGAGAGKLFICNVQAHGIEDQDGFNPTSRIVDSDLAEGGQLIFLERSKSKGKKKGKKKRSKRCK